MALPDRLNSLRGYLLNHRVSGRVYRPVIEATNACNLRCTMCPRNNMARKTEHMDKDLFEKIISENSGSLEFVSLNGYGEPLLHPGIFDLLEICKKYGVSSGISTNCTQLNDEMIQGLMENGPDLLTLAFDGTKKENYQKVRVGADFESVLEGIKRYLELRMGKRNRTYVVLQCIYMTETKDTIKGFYKLFSPYGKKGYDAIRIRQLTYSGNNREDADYRNTSGSCYWLWNEPMILSNGLVVPCCQDVNGELSLGNVKYHSICEMWTGEKITELRRMHAKGERSSIPICRSCNMYQPGIFWAIGSSFLKTTIINKLVPDVETMLSSYRYKF